MVVEEVILFHSHNCIHCVRMLDEWKKFVELVESEYKNIEIKTIESADISDKDSSRYSGYPTIIFVVGGKDIQYEGNRTLEAFKQFLDKLISDSTIKQSGGKKTHNYHDKYKKYKKMYSEIVKKYNSLVKKYK